jgi:hypothetical protein
VGGRLRNNLSSWASDVTDYGTISVGGSKGCYLDEGVRLAVQRKTTGCLSRRCFTAIEPGFRGAICRNALAIFAWCIPYRGGCGQDLHGCRGRWRNREDAAKECLWGDRNAYIYDPFGHGWGLGAPKENLTMDQIKERSEQHWKQPTKY